MLSIWGPRALNSLNLHTCICDETHVAEVWEELAKAVKRKANQVDLCAVIGRGGSNGCSESKWLLGCSTPLRY
eukprot:451088-Alexandrium_andersonii.AAC.1